MDLVEVLSMIASVGSFLIALYELVDRKRHQKKPKRHHGKSRKSRRKG